MQYSLECALDLQNKSIDDEGLGRVLSNISDYKSIVRINLSFNQLTIDGARQLVEFIKKIPQIDYLDLTSNKLNDEAASLFSDFNIREIHFEGNPMTGITLNSYFNNKHILFLAYQHDRGNELANEIIHKLETHLDHNRLRFRARMVYTFIVIAQARRQVDNIFFKLPLPLVAHILRILGADFQYANTALSDPLSAVDKCVEYILDTIVEKRLQTKVKPGSRDFFFKKVCGLVPLGDKFIENEDQEDKNKKCVIM